MGATEREQREAMEAQRQKQAWLVAVAEQQLRTQELFIEWGQCARAASLGVTGRFGELPAWLGLGTRLGLGLRQGWGGALVLTLTR